MSIHVAILLKPYLQLILRGRKTIESRLMVNPGPPWDRVAPGERIFFKVSAGPFLATAVADAVDQHRDLTVPRLRELYRKYNTAVCGKPEYWRMKKRSRFAVFVHLRDVEPIDVGPEYEQSNWKAWFVLPDADSPLLDLELTAGAIRNRYVRAPGSSPSSAGFFPTGAFDLLLPDGQRVQTEVNTRRLIRWRGWGGYYDRHRLAAGDRVRFIRRAERLFEVRFPAWTSKPTSVGATSKP